jgi:PAS domain S-box-containing protein
MKKEEKTEEYHIDELEQLRKRIAQLEAFEAQRRRAAKALKDSEAQKKAILDASVDRIRLVDRDLRIIWANKTALRSLNIASEDLVGKHCYKAFHGRKTPCTECPSRKALKTGRIEHTILYRPKGQEVIKGETYVDSYGVPIKDESGEIVTLIQINRDITETKTLEQALRRREKELELKTASLEEANAALKVLLKRRDEDKIELEEKVLSNVKELIVPYVEKIKKSHMDERQMGLLGIIESNLQDIIAPFSRQLSSKFSSLTPKEIQVAGLVKEGKTTKEMAALLVSTTDAIEFHRKNLRKKLGLKNTKANLRSYLMSLP